MRAKPFCLPPQRYAWLPVPVPTLVGRVFVPRVVSTSATAAPQSSDNVAAVDFIAIALDRVP